MSADLVPRGMVAYETEEAGGVAGSTFTLMQWNTLADHLSGPNVFSRPSEQDLAWPQRASNILEEIHRFSPDVLTLQEVDHFFDHMQPQLEGAGYVALFAPKPCNKDGSATFFRASKFSLVAASTFNYVSSGGHHVENQLALCVVLRFNACEADERPQDFMVVNTHLKASKTKDGEETREEQVRQLEAHVREQRDMYAAARGRQLPGLICGDFNATLEDKPEYPARAVPLMLACGYRSLYDLYAPDMWSTWKFRPSQTGPEHETKHTIDYMLAMPGTAYAVKSLASIPTADEVGSDALPSARYPSDHLSLAAEIELR